MEETRHLPSTGNGAYDLSHNWRIKEGWRCKLNPAAHGVFHAWLDSKQHDNELLSLRPEGVQRLDMSPVGPVRKKFVRKPKKEYEPPSTAAPKKLTQTKRIIVYCIFPYCICSYILNIQESMILVFAFFRALGETTLNLQILWQNEIIEII